MAQTFKTINPATLKPIREYKFMSEGECAKTIEQANGAFKVWRSTLMSQRVNVLRQVRDEVLKSKMELALLMTEEMGKPITQSLAEIDKCAGLIEYACDHAESIFIPQNRGTYSVYYQPLGIIYGIMPWNFPVWQTLRFAVPTLLAGNTILLKPAENVAGTALKLQECFNAVQRLNNVYSTIIISHTTSDAVIASPYVHGVSLTGSSRAGSHVASIAGQFLKKCVLELGGNDAYVVCEDADLDLAVEKVFQARLLNAGQSCISAKRVFVHKSIESQFVDRLIDKIKTVKVLDPKNSDSQLGPVARLDLLEGLQKQVDRVIKDGARVAFKQDIQELEKQGSYFPITVLQNISAKNCVHTEELFGPVYSIISFNTNDEVISMANSSQYGLGGAIFSKNPDTAKRLALEIETGSLAINDSFRSTFDRPFGGVKSSGFGRELGAEGFREFTNIKVLI